MYIANLIALAAVIAHPQPHAMYTQSAFGVPVRVIRVDLADPRVRIEAMVANGFPGRAEPFDAMVARAKPTIAINGAYFSKDTLLPIGDIVVNGEQLRKGMMGTAFAVTRDNQASIKRVTWGHATNWSGYNTVIACGPALVLNGKVDVQPEAEGFRDPHVMGSARRMGIGLTADRRLLIVTTLAPVTFERWAAVMRALDCQDAMNLDAGASLAMHYRGKTFIKPGRPLTNILLVYVDESANARDAR